MGPRALLVCFSGGIRMILYESDVNTSASSFFNRFASNFYVRSWSRSSNIMCWKTHVTNSNAYNTNKHAAQGYRGEIRGAARGLIAGQISSSTVLSSRWTSGGSPEGPLAAHAERRSTKPPSANRQTAHAAQLASASPFHPWPLFNRDCGRQRYVHGWKTSSKNYVQEK